MILLVDCNNFFVSCERLFRPDLEKKPVAVLSNNDGCIIARSNEVKEMGIPMGAPVFKYQKILKNRNVTLFSGNFSLYGNISNRLIMYLQSISPELEAYSIDECFLSIDNVPESWDSLGHKIKEQIYRWIGIPVSIGIAETKTLAKLATHLAKLSGRGVFVMSDYNINNILKTVNVKELWGIGKRNESILKKYGIHTAYQYKEAPEYWVKKKLTIMGHRTQLELKGIRCIEIETKIKKNKQIISSRSLGKKVTRKADLLMALIANIEIISRRLREQGQVTTQLIMMIATDLFKSEGHQYAIVICLPRPTNITSQLINAIKPFLDRVYQEGKSYKKTGVIAKQLSDSESQTDSFLWPRGDHKKESQLMAAIDQINNRYQYRLLGYGYLTKETKSNWKPRQNQRSPHYTTAWQELPDVKLA